MLLRYYICDVTKTREKKIHSFKFLKYCQFLQLNKNVDFFVHSFFGIVLSYRSKFYFIINSIKLAKNAKFWVFMKYYRKSSRRIRKLGCTRQGSHVLRTSFRKKRCQRCRNEHSFDSTTSEVLQSLPVKMKFQLDFIPVSSHVNGAVRLFRKYFLMGCIFRKKNKTARIINLCPLWKHGLLFFHNKWLEYREKRSCFWCWK